MRTGEEAVATLLDCLDRTGAAYMLVGSFSSNFYGVPRATRDADFVGELLDFPYIERWCPEHGTLEVLAEAREAARID